MKTSFFLLYALFAFIASQAAAALPDVVLEQIRNDVREAMTQKGQTPPTSAVEEIYTMVVREMTASDTPFVLSPSDLVEFRNETPSVTDAELNRVMGEFKKGVHFKPLPHLLAYYDRQREAKALTPRQKILSHLLTLRLAKIARVTISPAPKP